MANITTCTTCGQAYEAGSEEQANEPVRICPSCRAAPAKKDPRYRWRHASEWLDWKIGKIVALDDRQDALTELAALTRILARHMDGDQIQDEFQSEMDADGFFDDLDAKEDDDAG